MAQVARLLLESVAVIQENINWIVVILVIVNPLVNITWFLTLLKGNTPVLFILVIKLRLLLLRQVAVTVAAVPVVEVVRHHIHVQFLHIQPEQLFIIPLHQDVLA